MNFKSLSVLTLTTFLSFGAFAQSTIKDEVASKLENLNSKIAELENSVTLEIQNMKVYFPDFEKASNNFVELLKQQSEKFQTELQTMPALVSEQLSLQHSEYLALTEAAKENPKDEILKKLVERKEREMKEALKWVENQMNDKYSKALENMITLSHQKDITIIGNILVLKYMVGDASYGNVGRTSEYSVYSKWSDDFEFYYWNLDRKIFIDQFGVGGWESRSRLYRDCTTAGCVYKMSEIYYDFFSKVYDLNQKVKLTDGITLKKINLPSKLLVKRAIRKLTEKAADLRPIGEFEIEE